MDSFIANICDSFVPEMKFINQFLLNVPILQPQKTPEN